MPADLIADELAVRALLDRYTDAVNRRDWDAYRACWTDDAVWELHAPVNQRKEGIDAIMAEVQHAVGAMDFFFQMPHAVVVTLDGDRATARVSLQEVGRAREGAEPLPGATGMTIYAMYHDEVVRVGGAWRFKQRTYDVASFAPHGPEGDTVGLLPR